MINMIALESQYQIEKKTEGYQSSEDLRGGSPGTVVGLSLIAYGLGSLVPLAKAGCHYEDGMECQVYNGDQGHQGVYVVSASIGLCGGPIILTYDWYRSTTEATIKNYKEKEKWANEMTQAIISKLG